MKTIALLVLAAAAGCSYAHADAVPTLAAVTVSGQTIMPLGDSITYGVNQTNLDGYRYQLYQDFIGAGQTLQFVGSQTSGSDLHVGQQANEGHGGYTLAQISSGVNAWLAAQPATTRLILMVMTNDADNYATETPNTWSAAYASLLDQIHTDCPACIIYDCSILPLTNVTTAVLYKVIIKINAEIKSACLHRSFCRFIDTFPALTWPTDFEVTGVHPTDAGYVKLGNAIYNGIVAYGSASVQGY